MRWFLVLLIVILAGCSMQYDQTRDMMDTYVTIKVVADDQHVAQDVMDAAFKEIKRVESKFTIYSNSSISRLNDEKKIVPDDEILYVMNEAKMYSKITDGNFDITVQPILDLYSRSFEIEGRAPTALEIEETLMSVDYRRMYISEELIAIPNNTRITLGGIVKGYAIDRAIEVLKMKGIKAGLVNAGGDLRGYGKKVDGSNWNIALRNPDDPTDYITIIEVDDEAVATSGNYERYFDESKKFHHIVDPKTGYSANELISATVKADTAMKADALATAVFVMGEKGLDFLEDEGLEGVLIDNDRDILKTSS